MQRLSPDDSSRRMPAARRRRASFPLYLLCACLLLSLSGCFNIFARPTVKYLEYTVRRGDTLYAIAQRFHVSVDEIMEISDIGDPKELQPGQVIRLPYRGQAIPGRNGIVQTRVAPRKIEPEVGSQRTVSISPARHYIGRLLWPVRESELSSPFGKRWFSFHEGIDLTASKGTPIRASHRGVVAYSGDGINGYGNLIILKGDGLVTVYGHNKANDVRVGDEVAQGDVIGEVGNTGKSTGPHLHFETRIRTPDGKLVAVDPLVFFRGESFR